jgi:hypothetical protein
MNWGGPSLSGHEHEISHFGFTVILCLFCVLSWCALQLKGVNVIKVLT